MSQLRLVGKTSLLDNTFQEVLTTTDGELRTEDQAITTKMSDGSALVRAMGIDRANGNVQRQIDVNSNGQLSNVSMNRFLSTPPTLNNGDFTDSLCDVNGNLKVSVNSSKSVIDVGDNVSIADNAFTTSYDLRNFSKVRIYGNCSVNQTLMIQYSDDNSNWKFIDSLQFLTLNGNQVANHLIDVPPNYIRFGNFSGNSLTIGMRIMGIP